MFFNERFNTWAENSFGFVFNQFLGGGSDVFSVLSTVSAIFPRFWEFIYGLAQ